MENFSDRWKRNFSFFFIVGRDSKPVPAWEIAKMPYE
jgi:hypothetical protein